VILANPPFMSPKGGIRPHKRFSVQATRSEVLFVDYIAEHLTPQGRAAVIVPEGIIFQSGTAYKQLRKMLVEKYLYAVVSLPAGVFSPYSGVKTSILFMDRLLAATSGDSVLFVKVENDGFSLGAQRREIEKNDLPGALEAIREFYKGLRITRINADKNKDKIRENPRQSADKFLIVPKAKIAESGDYNLTGERYRVSERRGKQKWPMVKLGEVCVVIAGQSPEGKYYNEEGTGTPFYQGKTEFTDKYIGAPVKWTTRETKIAEPDDILMSVRAPVGPVNLATQRICIGCGLAAIRPSDNIMLMYLFTFLKINEKNIKGKNGAVFDSISKQDIESLEIPLPPLEVQRELVAEIEGYQKIIDGARQVTDNWKPRIDVDPDWPVVKLGEEVCEARSETVDPHLYSGDVEYIGLENIESNSGYLVGDTLTDYSNIKSLKRVFQKSDVLYGKLRPNLNKVWQATFSGICSTDIYVLRAKAEILPILLETFLRSNRINKQILNGVSGSQLPRVSFEYIADLEIPLPPLAVQREIAAAIEAERTAVDACRELALRYEARIRQAVERV